MNKTIYMTYKKAIPDLVCSRWKTLNKDYEIELSLDDDCIRFLETHFNSYIANLFKQIPVGMYKADLWRLCKLYVHGGVYADVDMIPYLDIDTLDVSASLCTCLSKNGGAVFQAFIISKPKNPLLLQFLISFLLNNPQQYPNGPCYDMYKCISYTLGVPKLHPEIKYEMNDVKIHVDIGTSNTNIKTIDLHYFPTDVPYTIFLHPHTYSDQLSITLNGTRLTVKRLDANLGWGHPHSCYISIPSKESIFFFREWLGDNDDWRTSYVMYKGTKIFDSRDMTYHNNGGW